MRAWERPQRGTAADQAAMWPGPRVISSSKQMSDRRANRLRLSQPPSTTDCVAYSGHGPSKRVMKIHPAGRWLRRSVFL